MLIILLSLFSGSAKIRYAVKDSWGWSVPYRYRSICLALVLTRKSSCTPLYTSSRYWPNRLASISLWFKRSLEFPFDKKLLRLSNSKFWLTYVIANYFQLSKHLRGIMLMNPMGFQSTWEGWLLTFESKSCLTNLEVKIKYQSINTKVSNNKIRFSDLLVILGVTNCHHLFYFAGHYFLRIGYWEENSPLYWQRDLCLAEWLAQDNLKIYLSAQKNAKRFET